MLQKLLNIVSLFRFLRPCRALCVVLVLAACGKQHSNPAQEKQARLGHVHHFDIPTPLGFIKATQTEAKKERGMTHDFMQYTGTMPVGPVIAFYAQEMERAGWDITDLSGDREGFLYCTKPNKRCGIQVRTNVPPIKNMPTTLSLFVTTLS